MIYMLINSQYKVNSQIARIETNYHELTKED